ncbi:MAG: NUDIX hydrolase [Acidimicrobiales bacterium]
MTDPAATNTFPAATVVLLRDGEQGLESLMLRRNAKLEFAGGMWVWPGGRIDPSDYPEGRPDDRPEVLEAAARRAAAREALEEADLVVDPDGLVWFSHWTPPTMAPKRFLTYFFAGPAPEGAVQIDGGEIHGHAWMTPAEAMRRHNALEIELSPPTWITLEQLATYASTQEALTAMAARPPEWYATRFAGVDGGAVVMYHGDAGYEVGDPDQPGGRHRLWMLESGWRYERTDRS